MIRLLRPPLTPEDAAQEEAALLEALVRNCERRTALDAQGSPDGRCFTCPSCQLLQAPAHNRLLFAATLRLRLLTEEHEYDPEMET